MNFLSVTKRIEPSSFWSMTQRIELSFLKYDSKNRTHFLNVTSFSKKLKNWTLFQKNDSKNLNLFEHDPMNWAFFNMTRRNELFFLQKITQRIEISGAWLKELNFFECHSKNWNFFWKKTLKELIFSQKYDTKNWTFFQYDSKIFELWLKELNSF